MKHLPELDALIEGALLETNEWLGIIKNKDLIDRTELYERADKVRHEHFGNTVYLRGLIEFSSYCKNDCYYCGLRRSNTKTERYRLSTEDVLSCCEAGYELGFRTFVLQSGEDVYNTRERVTDLITAIRSRFDDCAITLSLGEYPGEVYETWFEAGANRYLLRHETALDSHYRLLHPKSMQLQTRLEALRNLKRIGFQVGAGFMVGSPGQTPESLAEDMTFLQHFSPHMVGIGPFIPHRQTPFRDCPPGTVTDTLFFLALTRLAIPDVLLPATTALGSIDPSGQERGLSVGANVLMPNLSPERVRDKYSLYDGKKHTGVESAEGITELRNRLNDMGYQAVIDRGDSPRKRNR